MQIAIDASQSQILEVVRAAMNFRDYVFDVKHGEWRVVLMKAAILTSIAGALSYPSSRPR